MQIFSKKHLELISRELPLLGKSFLVVLVFSMIHILIIVVAHQYIPYKVRGSPYWEPMLVYGLHPILLSLANFDGSQYSLIADQEGYFMYQQAYFPLYPLLMWFLAPLLSYNHPIAGLFISFMSLVGALYFLNKVFFALFPKHEPIYSLHPGIFLLLVLPCSFFFSAVYTESLFLFLMSVLLYGLIRKKHFLVWIFALCASLTKLIGLFLLIPTLSQIWKEKERKYQIGLFVGAFASLLGLVSYMGYLWSTAGDPLLFFRSQTIFNSSRSTSLIFLPQVTYRYLKIFVTARLDVNYFVAIVEFGITWFYLLILGRVSFDLIAEFRNRQYSYFNLRVGLLVFSIVNLLLPTLTGTLSSVPRYSLLSLSILPLILGWKKNWQVVFVGVSVALHMLLLGLFSQGYFVS